MSDLIFSVFTPTYNRSSLLPRVYTSLCEQTFQSFEWIVGDDGSQDETASLVKRWQAEAKFPIRYFWQENSGKHVAFNRGVELAQGKLFVCLDSDDWLVPNALERIWHHWNQIPEDVRSEYEGVAGLCATPDGAIIGTPFPADTFDANAVTIRTLYKVKGDKFGANRVDVLRRFPFPEGIGKFVTEAVVWNRIARHYKTRFVNEVFAYVEYQAGGQSDWLANRRAMLMRRAELALANRLYYREFGELPAEWVPLRARWRAYVEYVRFSFFAKVSLANQYRESNNKWLFLTTFPVGTALYWRDLYRLWRLRRMESAESYLRCG